MCCQETTSTLTSIVKFQSQFRVYKLPMPGNVWLYLFLGCNDPGHSTAKSHRADTAISWFLHNMHHVARTLSKHRRELQHPHTLYYLCCLFHHS